MSKLDECKDYIRDWYLNGYVVTIMMDANDEMDDYCIQAMVVELLKEFVDHGIPGQLVEGTQMFNVWVDTAFRKVMTDLDFGFSAEQEDQVKNLAFNYYAEGVEKVRNNPSIQLRRYKCRRRQGTKH